tara:strand:- start:26 stop:862 length:837 start_codon:yes stop_codon:yes gene_type:complete
MEELKTSDGQSAGYWGTRRTDSGKVLGVTSDKYGLLLNSTLVDSIEEVLTDKGLDYSKKVRVARDGATMYATYDFPSKNITVPNVGDTIGMRITGRNSYDRSCFAGLDLAALREVCTNGMKALRSTFTFNQKHSSKLDLSGVSKAIDAAVTAFDSIGEDFGLLADAKIDNTIGDYILKNLRDSKVLSNSLREEITKVWLNPTYKEDEGRNLYNLYNAATQHLASGKSRNAIENDRYEYASKVNETILRKLTKAAKDEKFFAKLTRKPVSKSDDVLVTA